MPYSNVLPRSLLLLVWRQAFEALLQMGATVVATDLAEILPHLEYNISLNAHGGAS